MGHLPIVNQETMEHVKKEGFISIKAKLPEKKIINVISSMFADVLAVRKGDLIFPWITKSKRKANIGFKYVFKVAGPPILVEGDEYPIKIPLQKHGWEFQMPLSEMEALDLWRRKLLWNAIGKKSLRWGKSFTHQLPMEDELMLELLNKKNNNGCEMIFLTHKNIKGKTITINTKQTAWDQKMKRKIDSAVPKEKIRKIKIRGLPWVNGKYFTTEKTLEAWLIENFDKKVCKNLKKLILPRSKLIWFGSYLPFGVQGGNIDIVMIQKEKNKEIITVIELKVGPLSSKEFESAAKQAVNYSIFLRKAYSAFGKKVILNPIVISGLPKRKTDPSKMKIRINNLSPSWISYSINEKGAVKFQKNL